MIGRSLASSFDRIFVINLVHRADRRREMAAQMQRIGLDLSAKPCQLFEAVRPAEAGDWPSLGARGCFASHLGVLRLARDAGVRSLLLMEDDVNWSPTLLQHSEPYLDALASDDWDFFHGGSSDLEGTRDAPHVRSVPSDEALPMAHCIGLRGAILPAMIDYLTGIAARPAGDPAGGKMHVDGAYSWFRRDHPEVRTLTFLPTMAYQRASDSDIAGLSRLAANPLLRPLVKLGRRIKNLR